MWCEEQETLEQSNNWRSPGGPTRVSVAGKVYIWELFCLENFAVFWHISLLKIKNKLIRGLH